VDVKLRLPQQHRGHHDQLEELAAILSAEANVRQARTIDLTAHDDIGSTILPQRRRMHPAWRVGGGVVLALGTVAVALLASSFLKSTKPAPTAAPALVAVTAPTSLNDPASWGVAARARLSAGGRPVSEFGCIGAYEVDVPRSSGMLPIAYQGTPEFAAYMQACVSDMSGHGATPNEVAH